MTSYSTVEKESFRQTIHNLLQGCHVSPRRASFDHDLHQLCLNKCQRDGVPLDVEGEVTVKEYLAPGVIMVSTAYAHIPRQLQTIIALYVTFTIWIDDRFAANPEPLASFGARFVRGEAQVEKGLDAWVKVIKELMEIYPAAQANLICTASLNFMTAMLVEDGLKKQPVRSSFTMALWDLNDVRQQMCIIGHLQHIFGTSPVHAKRLRCSFSRQISPFCCSFGQEHVSEHSESV